jgi:hypothetical protein
MLASAGWPARVPSSAVPDHADAPRTVLAQVGAGVAGLLLLVGTGLRWSGTGAGSRIALVEVADLLLSGRLDSWAPRPLGLVVYAVPLGGALLLVGAGLGGRAGRALSLAAVGLAAVGTLLARAALTEAGAEGWGPGAVVAVVGVVLGAAATLGRPSDAPAPPGGADR